MSRLRLSQLSKELRNLANRIPLTEDSTPEELAEFLLEAENLRQEAQSLKIVDMKLEKYSDTEFWSFLGKTLPMLNNDSDMADVCSEVRKRIAHLDSVVCKWSYALYNQNHILLSVVFPHNAFINGDQGLVEVQISHKNPNAMRTFTKGEINIYKIPLSLLTHKYLERVQEEFNGYCNAVSDLRLEHKVVNGRKYFCAVFDDVDKSNLFIEAMEFVYGYKVGVLAEENGLIYVADNSDYGVEV